MIRFKEMKLEDLELFQKWLTAPHVSKWYEHPADWIEEVKKQETEFQWIHHYMVECDGKDIGFCQYYACEDSDELWEGYTVLGGSYSIDYMIGEPDYLRKGFGREIVMGLVERIRAHSDAKRVVVQPEQENLGSSGVLLASGFVYDAKTDIYVMEL